MRWFLAVSLFFSTACETGQVQRLEAGMDDVTATLSSYGQQISALRGELMVKEARILALEELLAAVSVNAEGDLVLTGINLYVQDGQGETDTLNPNGKGNVILGYDEPRIEGTCVGGAYHGLNCSDAVDCPNGVCDGEDVSSKTGSHNLIVGPGHSYDGSASVLVGSNHNVEDNVVGAAIAGAGNTVSASWAAVSGGARNVASGLAAVVSGGSGNEAAAYGSTVSGGYHLINNDASTHVP